MNGILFLLWAMLCLAPNQRNARQHCSGTQVTTTLDDSGDNGHVPPKPPTPPPPPPPGNP